MSNKFFGKSNIVFALNLYQKIIEKSKEFENLLH